MDLETQFKRFILKHPRKKIKTYTNPMGQKVYHISDYHVDANGSIPAKVYNNADVLYYQGSIYSPSDDYDTYSYKDMNLPISLERLHIIPSYSFRKEDPGHVRSCVLAYNNKLLVGSSSESEPYTRRRATFDEVLDLFMKHIYPKMKIPYGCKVYFGNKEIVP